MDIKHFKISVRELLMTPKLYNFEKTVYFDYLESTYLNILLKKLLVNHKYQLYNNFQKGNDITNKYQFDYMFPIFELNKPNDIANLSIDAFKKLNDIDTIILPIIIYNNDNHSGHIICCYINFKYKYILFYDSYGQKDYFKQIIKLIMNFLNKLYDFTLKEIIIDCPWHEYIKDDSNTWLYDGSCLILIGLFTYLYFFVNNNKDFYDLIINFSESIKKNDNLEIFKDLITFTYVALLEG